MEEKIIALYKDPKIGLAGVQEIFRRAKELGYPVDFAKVKEIIEKLPEYQITKPNTVRKKNFNKIGVRNPLFQFQVDVAYVDKYDKENKGIKYLLMIIDSHTRYLWVVPMKDRTSADTKKALESVLEKVGFPENINLDEGVEFQGACEKYLKDNNVVIWTSSPDTHTRKNALVERVIGTLRRKMLNYMTTHDTTRYIDVLGDLVDNYNNSYHRGIKTTPNNAWNHNTQVKLENPNGNNKEYNIGDIVRVKVIKKQFEKEIPTWSTETYKILEKDGMGYIVIDNEDNKLRRGRRIGVWMPYELQKATDGTKSIAAEIKAAVKDKKQRQLLNREDIKNENVVPRTRAQIRASQSREMKALKTNATEIFIQPAREKRERKVNSKYAT